MLITADERYVSVGDTVYIVYDGPQDVVITDVNSNTATVRFDNGCTTDLDGSSIWATAAARDAWLRN